MEGKCSKMRGEILRTGQQKDGEQQYKVSSPCLDDHYFQKEELESVGELSDVCSQIVLKCLYLARFGRPDISWTENKLARSVTRWTKAWPGEWGPQGMSTTGGGGLVRVPNLRVCKHLCIAGGTRRGGRMN